MEDEQNDISENKIEPSEISAEKLTTSSRLEAVDIAHFSMQFSDTKLQQNRDAAKIFRRGYDWITGTEAGYKGTLIDVLRVGAATSGYAFHVYKSNWIAVRKDRIRQGSFDKGGETVVDSDVTVGNGSDSNVAWVQFYDGALGRTVTVLCSHYPTRGRPNSSQDQSVNLKHNKTLARAIGDLAEKEGKGKALVFYGGDQNIVDRIADTFFGEPLTSAWDELKKHRNTGHGNIDVIASLDKDRQVEAKYVRALDDKKLFLFTDHFPVEAGYKVRSTS